METAINYIGHSAFFIENETAGILIDPFISGNPNSVFKISPDKIKDILVTHGHGDHLGDAIPLSKKTGAQITTIFELANYCQTMGATVNGINMGGRIKLNGAFAKFMPAFHSSSTPDGKYAGMPSSIILEIGGKRIYHAGDTCLHQEMKVIGEFFKPDIAFLPIGSHYTMDVNEAATAAQWLNTQTVIPMHYNTFPVINADVQCFKEKIEKEGKKCVILNPGESFSI